MHTKSNVVARIREKKNWSTRIAKKEGGKKTIKKGKILGCGGRNLPKKGSKTSGKLSGEKFKVKKQKPRRGERTVS